MIFSFYKMHGLGNDFVIIDQRATEINLTPETIRLIADRRLGIGCDQVIIIKNHPHYDCSMEIFNQDGSAAEACGNAARCVSTLMPNKLSKILVGKRVLEANNSIDGVTINMGHPEFSWEKIPMTREQDNPLVSFETSNFETGIVVNIGNPHLIFFTDNLADIDINTIGPRFEHHKIFPNKINVSFAHVVARDSIILRVWERGVGETQACGTAACATFAGARKLMLIDNKATIKLPGGALHCAENANGTIEMHGPATMAFKGEWGS